MSENETKILAGAWNKGIDREQTSVYTGRDMETGLQSDWPKRIRALMKKRGLHANELAGEIGCHQLTLERWLRGERPPSDLAQKALERLEAECRERDDERDG